jgi:hypothetical protein
MLNRRQLFGLGAAAIVSAFGIKAQAKPKPRIFYATQLVSCGPNLNGDDFSQAKIRGYRANSVICDEYSHINPELIKHIQYTMPIDNKPESIWYTGESKIWTE